jgi:hypothetical protein
MDNNADILIVSIVLSIAVFLLLREVFCWYFKINKRISLLSDIKDELVQANRYTLKLHKFSLKNVAAVAVKHTNEVKGEGKGVAYSGRPKIESFWKPE